MAARTEGEQQTPAYATVAELRRAITIEILVAVGVPRRGPFQKLLAPLVWPPAHRFATLAARFDREVAHSGLSETARLALPYFVDEVQVEGAEHVPAEGPLLVASNHPGSYDPLAVLAGVGRDDLKILASDVPILHKLTATSRHFVYIPSDPHRRMRAVRKASRHLRSGGALLIYPSAQVDPDPALLPGSEEAVEKWSSSLPLLLRLVPETKVVVSIISDVLSPACFRSPLTRLRPNQRLKQFLAEFLQIGQQIMFGRDFGLKPVVRFSPALGSAELGDCRDDEACLEAIKLQALEMLASIVAPAANS